MRVFIKARANPVYQEALNIFCRAILRNVIDHLFVFQQKTRQQYYCL